MENRLNADDIASPYIDDKVHGSKYFSHLRRRLRWQLLVAYLTPLLLLSAVFHYQYYETLKREIETHLKSVAENKRNTVSLFLQERVANVKSAFHFESLPTPPSSIELGRVLEAMRKESAAFVDLGLFSPSGELIAYAGPYSRLLGKDYSGELWFRRLLRQESEYYISDVYLGFRRKPHFIIAVRKSINGQKWSLRASVDPKKFSEFVSSSMLLKRGEALIVNRQGDLQTTSSEQAQRQMISQAPKVGLDTRVVEVNDRKGISYLSAYAWLTETDWAVVVRIPTFIAYAPMRRARMLLLIILAPALILLSFFVVTSTRRIVGRLEEAVRAKEDLRAQVFNAAKLASLGEMAAGVAHEINNPLAIIYEEAGLMKDSLDPQFGQNIGKDDWEESLKAIMDAALRGRSITGKLLAFARKSDVDKDSANINQLIDRVLSMKQREIEVSGIEMRKELAEELPDVFINSNQMEQVLLNLLNNATDAIESVRRSGRITVRTRRVEEFIYIEVQDTGCGMSVEQMEKIFFPFYTTKKVGKGTGLGLAISYGIVKAAGGRIEVTSELGIGSTFSIILPIAQKEPKSSGESFGDESGNRQRNAY